MFRCNQKKKSVLSWKYFVEIVFLLSECQTLVSWPLTLVVHTTPTKEFFHSQKEHDSTRLQVQIMSISTCGERLQIPKLDEQNKRLEQNNNFRVKKKKIIVGLVRNVSLTLAQVSILLMNCCCRVKLDHKHRCDEAAASPMPQHCHLLITATCSE